MATLRQIGRKLRRDQRGAAALTYLICFPVITLALLSAIDFIRYNMAQSKLQNALDITVLSAGRNLDHFTPDASPDAESAWRQDAISYFYSNMPKNFLGGTIAEDDVSITYNEESNDQSQATGQLVHMTASGTLPLLITGYLNQTAFRLYAENKAVRRTRSDIEMVLALDHTGSMRGNKIETLKKASADLVDKVLGAADNSGKLDKTFIGIVPFADTVYVGDERRYWLNAEAQQYPYIQSGSVWDGCVLEPYDGAFKAESGLPGQFTPLMTWGTKTFTPAETAEKLGRKSGEIKLLSVSGERIIDTRSVGDTLVARFAFPSRYIQYGNSNTNCSSSRAMAFLSNETARLKEKITDLSIDGRTIIPLGLLWSWRMLDPNWRGDSGWGDDLKPRDAAPGLSKIIVLLTDGNNGLDPLDPNNTSNHSDDVAIDAEPIAASYVINYQLTSGNETQSASYQDTLAGFSNDKHLLGRYFSNSSDFSSLRVGSEQEMNNNATTIAPYGKLYQGRSNGQDWQVGNQTLNKLTADLCENIKSQNISIYTVVLGDGINGSTKSLMQTCSSGVQGGYYFDATNVSDLPNAFSTIANSLTELHMIE
ncbi:Flp pilus assembly protein TadG|uniref:Flp pilus assembly protein TadG n=1 Tax=Brenneria salicis ATCC 15712 = DSM 30166 TaxID=714314 RepID=A0A366I5H7_9GAMM|nr:pilus assembly protein [Brenneria salicis]NMN92764.1 Flp pilus assembly protein TadG [Brenneria salicis ATCC 15712 = DSM 30166]RBP63741.1 Flp pilus assembly protein TadG [Brenneria salicis ATCC 15712 = DSM 30166]RLM31026.1 hypothetical protein BHG07_07430 [Brenneria salicis ATCC 15712 = DSM 30166]